MSERDEFEPAITETEAFLHSDGTWDGEQCHGTSGYLGVPFIRADLAAERERELVKALQQIATGRITGLPRDCADSSAVMRDVARKALAAYDEQKTEQGDE